MFETEQNREKGTGVEQLQQEWEAAACTEGQPAPRPWAHPEGQSLDLWPPIGTQHRRLCGEGHGVNDNLNNHHNIRLSSTEAQVAIKHDVLPIITQEITSMY